MNPLTPVDIDKARRALTRRDRTLGTIIKQVGPMAMKPRTDYYNALVQAIVGQQLSGKAAATIYGRVVKLVGSRRQVTPPRIARLSDTQLREAGLSSMKVSFIRDLTDKVGSRQIVLGRLAKLTDDEIITCLTAIKGIGVWSAQMYLMFVLHRPDVFPIDDLGIRNALIRAYGLTDKDVYKRGPQIAQKWRPYRTVASWYLWRSLDAGGL